jgi:hypothetical protein
LNGDGSLSGSHNRLADVPAAHGFLIAAVADGRITPEEAGHLAAVLDCYVTAVQAVEHEERLAAIEKSIKESKGAQDI